MPCLVLLLFLAFPRIALVLMFFFTTYLDRVFHHQILLPVLGFLFLPLTTLLYVWIVISGYPLQGVYLAALVVGAIVDLGSLGGGTLRRRWN